METTTAGLPEFITLSDRFAQLEIGESRFVRDLSMNWKGILSSTILSTKETALLGLSLAANAKEEGMIAHFDLLSDESQATASEKADAIACASMLTANNVFYRFRHFMNDPNYDGLPARLRMQAMMNPSCGKELFELMSIAISAVNGCEKCVVAHEHSLRELGTSREKIWESIRFASVFESARKLAI
ncbi:MAG: alkylhydroperoxidase [Cryomorphaceae bacterium]|nr:alkylhydroperoxidase [Cryomorphaceae bacterium]